jgi:hypothetical protein
MGRALNKEERERMSGDWVDALPPKEGLSGLESLI